MEFTVDTISNDADTLLKAGVASVEVRQLTDKDKPFVVVPDGYKVEDIESTLLNPIRKVASVTVADSASLIYYTKKHGSMDECVIYADINTDNSTCSLTAIINDHGADLPQWRDHQCRLTPKLSIEWSRWTGANRKVMSQLDFASFLEDNLSDIAAVPNMPTGTDMLQMALAFEANSNKKFRSKTNLQSGGFSIEFVDEEDHDTRATMKVFERFTLGIPVFDGSASAYPVEARMKYRESSGKLSFWYELIRADRVFKSAVADELQSLTRAVAADEDARKHKHHRLLAAGHDHRQFLLNALADHGPLTANECIAATGWSAGNTRWHLRTLVERGEAILINTGKVRRYALPGHRVGMNIVIAREVV